MSQLTLSGTVAGRPRGKRLLILIGSLLSATRVSTGYAGGITTGVAMGNGPLYRSNGEV